MLVHKSVEDFILELGSDSPAPGGGSTAALAGALGGALAAMVCRLTLQSGKYAEVHAETAGILAKAQQITNTLTQYIDEDTQAFSQVMAAYKLPKESAEDKHVRSQAIQNATKGATILPLKVAGQCLEVLELADRALAIGNANAASDAAVAGLMAYAGLQGALFNVKINLSGIKDTQFITETKEQLESIQRQADEINEQIRNRARTVIG